jgi:hypothetical protein
VFCLSNTPSLSNTLPFPVLVGPLWKTFESSLLVYVRSSIEGTEDSYEGRYDSDGGEKSLDSFVIQVMILMALFYLNML